MGWEWGRGGGGSCQDSSAPLSPVVPTLCLSALCTALHHTPQAQMQEQFAPAAALPLTATHATNGAGVPCSAASAAGCAPFVAAIVAPYEQRLPGLQSALTWFTVERRGSGGPSSSTSTSMLGGDGWVPRELSVERLLRRSTPTALSRLLPALGATAARYAAKRSAHALETPWRGSSSSSRLNKLLASVTAWWPALECGTAQSDAVRTTVWAGWSSAGGGGLLGCMDGCWTASVFGLMGTLEDEGAGCGG